MICEKAQFKFVLSVICIVMTQTEKHRLLHTHAHCEPAHSNQPSGSSNYTTVKVITEIKSQFLSVFI